MIIRLLLVPLLVSTSAYAQERTFDLGLGYTAVRGNSPPGTCGCFWLQGGRADASLPITRGISGTVELAGVHYGQVPATTRGLSVITLLAGPQIALPVLQRNEIEGHALIGAARGFDAVFNAGTQLSDTATTFAAAVGAGWLLQIRPSIKLQPVRIDLLITHLPNGADNTQRNLRVSTGLVIHFGLKGLHR